MKAIYVSPQVEIIEATNIQAVMETISFEGQIGGGDVLGNQAALTFEEEEEEEEENNDLWNKDLSLNWDLWD